MVGKYGIVEPVLEAVGMIMMGVRSVGLVKVQERRLIADQRICIIKTKLNYYTISSLRCDREIVEESRGTIAPQGRVSSLLRSSIVP